MPQVRILLGAPLLQEVGARGFEPPTSCAQGRRATRLRYAPRSEGGKYSISALHATNALAGLPRAPACTAADAGSVARGRGGSGGFSRRVPAPPWSGRA